MVGVDNVTKLTASGLRFKWATFVRHTHGISALPFSKTRGIPFTICISGICMYFRSLALVAALALQPAFGLDPSRSLTQYVHRIQQVSPQGTIFSIWQSHDG